MDYKHHYHGKDIYLSYFSTYPDSKWDYASRETPETIKNYIKELYTEIDDDTSNNTINHYGDITINDDNYNYNTIYHNEATETDEHGELGHLDSFSSIDDTPTRTTRTLIDIESSNCVDNEFELLGKWIINGFDLSKYLFNYRNISISDNNKKTHKELSISRRFQNKSCTKYLLDEAILNEVYRQLITTDYDVFLSKDITLWATNIQDTSKTGSRFDLELEMTNNLTNVATKKDINLVTAAHILINLTHTFVPQRDLNHHSEDTFVHGFISPFLNHIFFNDHNLACFWANKELSSHSHLPTLTSSIPSEFPELPSSTSPPASPTRKRSFNEKYKPDFTVYVPLFGYKFDLFIAEIKPPGSSLAIYDLPKISYEMKDMLGILVDQDVEEPRVCGLWVNELDSFELPKNMEDLTKIRDIMAALLKIKNIFEVTKNNLRRIITLKNCPSPLSSMDINWDLIPKKYWKRENMGKDKKVKKLKKK
ncbi:hypothetical protein BJ944DRAFT_248895 [Cunninghamella echinulata]|nr:hypothetical protein BJ944DRAFT_248895 [Cunninghamella echinulata]